VQQNQYKFLYWYGAWRRDPTRQVIANPQGVCMSRGTWRRGTFR